MESVDRLVFAGCSSLDQYTYIVFKYFILLILAGDSICYEIGPSKRKREKA